MGAGASGRTFRVPAQGPPVAAAAFPCDLRGVEGAGVVVSWRGRRAQRGGWTVELRPGRKRGIVFCVWPDRI